MKNILAHHRFHYRIFISQSALYTLTISNANLARTLCSAAMYTLGSYLLFAYIYNLSMAKRMLFSATGRGRSYSFLSKYMWRINPWYENQQRHQ
jgi:hypothetical protein